LRQDGTGLVLGRMRGGFEFYLETLPSRDTVAATSASSSRCWAFAADCSATAEEAVVALSVAGERATPDVNAGITQTIAATKPAISRPDTGLHADFGSSSRRRAASRSVALFARFARILASIVTSHGPMTLTTPNTQANATSTTEIPSWTGDCARTFHPMITAATTPARIHVTRGGLVRSATPSGDTTTRRRPRPALIPASTVIPATTPAIGRRPIDKSDVDKP